MSRNFKDVGYTKVDLNSPHKDFHPADTSVGLGEGEEEEAEEDKEPDTSGANNASADVDGNDDDEQGQQQQGKKPSVLSMAYYQRFFNVDTKQVGARILGSFVPRPGGRNLVADEIRHSPDLYGPFWVCTTLVFTTAIAGNVADYFQTASAGPGYVWVYDFRKVTFAATAIYLYWWLVPLLLWAVSWWRQLPEKYAFLELLCLYGYSLAIYIPVSVLCVVQVAILQWVLVLIGLALSGSVLALSLWPSIASGERRTAVALLTVAVVLHCLLAVGFKLYFFHLTTPSSLVPPVTPSAAASTTASAGGGGGGGTFSSAPPRPPGKTTRTK